MRKLSILLVFLMTSLIVFSQNNIIVMNNQLTKEYFKDYVSSAFDRGYDVQNELAEKIKYIIIVSDEFPVDELGKYDPEMKLITLNHKVTLDRLILKVTLYRELSHILGMPYNEGSVIMNRHQLDGFSYSAFDDIEIMDIELTKIFNHINYIPKSRR